jgi:hypothetical protein
MIFTRWLIVFKHDKAPVDECLYVHKNNAQSKLDAMTNKNKLEIKEMSLMNKELAEYLSKGIPALSEL